MHETTEQERSKKNDDSEQNAAGADAKATSKETVSDLEEKENLGSSSSEADTGPSPDGAFDASDEIKDVGPM